MVVTVRVFASLREAVGRSSWHEEIPEGMDSSALLDAIAEKEEGVARMRHLIRIAINDSWISGSRPLQDGDEVALLTPVSGG